VIIREGGVERRVTAAEAFLVAADLACCSLPNADSKEMAPQPAYPYSLCVVIVGRGVRTEPIPRAGDDLAETTGALHPRPPSD
jgi:hypothetical protein